MGEMLFALHENEKRAVQKRALLIKEVAHNTPLLMPLYDSQTNPDETIRMWGIGGLIVIGVAGFLMWRHESNGKRVEGSEWKGSESVPPNYKPETFIQPEDNISGTMFNNSELTRSLFNEIASLELQLKHPHSPRETTRLNNQLSAARSDLQNFSQGVDSFLRNEKNVIHKNK